MTEMWFAITLAKAGSRARRRSSELTLDLLNKIQILGKNGAQPPPNLALVLSIGCLRPRQSGWVLDNATDPIRATKPDEPTLEEVQTARTKLLGIRQYRVMDFGYLGADFEPDDYAGHKIQVKGYLIRQPEFERISVTSLADIAGRCR